MSAVPADQPESSEHGLGAGVFIALAPWVLFTIVAEHGTLKLASVIALAASVLIAFPNVRSGRPKVLEIGAVVAFAAFTVAAFTADAGTAEFVERYARAIAAGLLALIALGSLATVPFTEQYAREKVPPELWHSPTFHSINRRLSFMWAMTFAAMVPFHIVAGALNTKPTNLILNWIVPGLLVLHALKQTSSITGDADQPKAPAQG